MTSSLKEKLHEPGKDLDLFHHISELGIVKIGALGRVEFPLEESQVVLSHLDDPLKVGARFYGQLIRIQQGNQEKKLKDASHKSYKSRKGGLVTPLDFKICFRKSLQSFGNTLTCLGGPWQKHLHNPLVLPIVSQTFKL